MAGEIYTVNAHIDIIKHMVKAMLDKVDSSEMDDESKQSCQRMMLVIASEVSAIHKQYQEEVMQGNL